MPPKLTQDKFFTRMRHVWHLGREIGQTETGFGPGAVAFLRDVPSQQHLPIGTFADHEEAGQAVVAAWEQRP